MYDVHGLAHDAQACRKGDAHPPSTCSRNARGRPTSGFRSPAEMPHVLRICTLVEGLPLGIELAAAWVRTIPCGEIAAAIERTAASLGSRHRNRAERHRNLDAVVAYSWDLLAPEQEQRALAALSVFAGGFTREDRGTRRRRALRTLSVLVDKSLVRRRPMDVTACTSSCGSSRWLALRRCARGTPRSVRRHAEPTRACSCSWFADTPALTSCDAHSRLRSGSRQYHDRVATFDRCGHARHRRTHRADADRAAARHARLPARCERASKPSPRSARASEPTSSARFACNGAARQ